MPPRMPVAGVHIPGSPGQSREFMQVNACCATRRLRASVLAIVIHRQEVSPMNAVSAVGAPLQSTIARLR